jgi:membrane associated rhomboid family serine protease
LEKDFQLDKSWVLAATVVPPFLIYLSGKHDFINLIGAAGGIFIAIESTLVLLTWEKVKSKKLWLNRIIIAIFIVGAVYEILKRIG